MNKKKLPKAITPTAASTGAARLAASVAEPDRMAPRTHDPVGRSEATIAKQPTGPKEAPKGAPIEAKETPHHTTETIAKNRRGVAVKLAERYSVWSGVAGLIPVPFVDLATISAVQLQMLRRISRIYDIPFSENLGKALMASLAGSLIPATSVIGAASMAKSMPIVGTTVSTIAMPALSAGATYAIGMAFIQHFASGGTLLDFRPPDYHEFIKAQKKLRGKRA
jgi:uncharacterized protein (DUF697 family)